MLAETGMAGVLGTAAPPPEQNWLKTKQLYADNYWKVCSFLFSLEQKATLRALACLVLQELPAAKELLPSPQLLLDLVTLCLCTRAAGDPSVIATLQVTECFSYFLCRSLRTEEALCFLKSPRSWGAAGQCAALGAELSLPAQGTKGKEGLPLTKREDFSFPVK